MKGKYIGLIVSSASSGISSVVADAKRLIPEGNFLEPNLWIRSSQTSSCHNMTAQWLKDINYPSLTAINSVVCEEPEAMVAYNVNGQKITKGSQATGIRIVKCKRGEKTYSKKYINK